MFLLTRLYHYLIVEVISHHNIVPGGEGLYNACHLNPIILLYYIYITFLIVKTHKADVNIFYIHNKIWLKQNYFKPGDTG